MLALALLGVVSTASATVIDFNSIALVPTDNIVNVGTSFSGDGFNLTVSGNTLAALGPARADVTGQPALVVNIGASVTRTVTLTALSGNRFEIDSIDLAKWINTTTKTVNFTGNLLGGGTVTQGFSIPPLPTFALSTYLFPATLTNLTSLQWNTTSGGGVDNYHQFDNLVVNELPVPEPSTFALAVVGAAALLTMAYRGRSIRQA